MSKDDKKETKPAGSPDPTPAPMTLHEKLVIIQGQLVAPKNQKSNMYNYRSCEDILEAVKPLAHALGCAVGCYDEIVHIGDRYYVKATASITMGEERENGTHCYQSYAYAREEDSNRAMNQAQITGSTSSYARKYALNGLFAIDDCKDADTNEYRANDHQTPEDATQTTNASDTGAVQAESDGYPDKMMYTVAKKAIQDMCQRNKVEPGAGTTWIQGQYQGRTLEDMKDDEAMVLEVMTRMTNEFIPAHIAERNRVNETNN